MRALLEPKKHGKARSKAGSADGECVPSLFLRFNASASAKGIFTAMKRGLWQIFEMSIYVPHYLRPTTRL